MVSAIISGLSGQCLSTGQGHNPISVYHTNRVILDKYYHYQ